jgi:hypothetical protein
MNARVEVYMDGVLIATLPLPSVSWAHDVADYHRSRGLYALVIYGRA